MAIFNLSDFLAMTRAEARAGLLKGQLIFIIKYLASSWRRTYMDTPHVP